jgi:hypothetical protein
MNADPIRLSQSGRLKYVDAHVAANSAFAIYRPSWVFIGKLQCAPAEWRQTNIDASSFILSKNIENKNQNS